MNEWNCLHEILTIHSLVFLQVGIVSWTYVVHERILEKGSVTLGLNNVAKKCNVERRWPQLKHRQNRQIALEIIQVLSFIYISRYSNLALHYWLQGMINFFNTFIFSCVNPILYAFLSDNFRKAFLQWLPKCLFCLNNEEVNRRASGSLHYQHTTLRSSTRSSRISRAFSRNAKGARNGKYK